MHAIRQQHHKKLPVRIHPDGRSSEAGVAESVRAHKMATGAAFGGNGPAESSRAARKLLRYGEFGDRCAPQDSLVRVDAAVQQHLAERCEIRRGAENSSVTGNAPYRRGVLVVNFA